MHCTRYFKILADASNHSPLIRLCFDICYGIQDSAFWAVIRVLELYSFQYYQFNENDLFEVD